jgi:integrase
LLIGHLLDTPAIKLLDGASESYLFPSASHPDKHLSNMAMLMVLDRMGYGHVTVHGFRSTFKDWTRDRTRFENYVFESALAHASGDKIEAAYARGAVLDKRRKLMDAWAEYCAKPPAAGKVIPLRAVEPVA